MPPENLYPDRFPAGSNRPRSGEEYLASLRGSLEATTGGARACSTI